MQSSAESDNVILFKALFSKHQLSIHYCLHIYLFCVFLLRMSRMCMCATVICIYIVNIICVCISSFLHLFYFASVGYIELHTINYQMTAQHKEKQKQWVIRKIFCILNALSLHFFHYFYIFANVKCDYWSLFVYLKVFEKKIDISG